MDPQIADVMKAALYSAAAFGSVYAIARYSYLKRKSNNETHADRVQADMQKEQQRVNLFKELLANPDYKAFLENRKEVGEELLSKNPDALTWGGEQEKLVTTLDAICGKLPVS